MDSDDASRGSDALPRGELKRRATGGMFVVSSWGFVNLVVGFGGNLLLARMLVPRDFGLVAIGTTLIYFATTLSDGGLGSGLIRREQPPGRGELRAVLALQLTITLTIASLVAAVASRFGEPGLVAALMMCALPIAAFQTPGKVLLSRALLFQRLAFVDGAGIVVYYTWAVVGVMAGFGVWALATGAVVRALAASIAVSHLSGVGLIAPTLRGVRALAPVIRFGVSFQAIAFTNVAREQGINALTAALAGVSALGLWTLARRLLEVPLLLFESLWRVSFPVMSQLLARKEDPAPLIERSLALSVVAAGVLLTGVGGAAAEFVPAVFGEQWRETGSALAIACLALLIVGPVSVSSVGYLYAVGRPSAVLRASLAQTFVVFAVAAPLLPSIGVIALPAGWCVGAVFEAVMLGRVTAQVSGARILAPLVLPFAVAVACGLGGAWLAHEIGPGILAGLGGGIGASTAFTAALLLVCRERVLDMGRLVFDSVTAATSRRRPAPAASAPAIASTVGRE